MTSPLSPDRVRAICGTPANVPNTRLHSSISNRHADGRFTPNLRPEEVRDIRARYQSGEMGRTIAADYGISQPLVSMIGTGKRKAEIQ